MLTPSKSDTKAMRSSPLPLAAGSRAVPLLDARLVSANALDSTNPRVYLEVIRQPSVRLRETAFL